MVAAGSQITYTVAEAAAFLNLAKWFVEGAIKRGDLLPDEEGRLTRQALLTFLAEHQQREDALREVMGVSEDSGLYEPDLEIRLEKLGIIPPLDTEDADEHH